MTEDPRISEIRAAIDGYDTGAFKDKLQAFDRIRAILDHPAPAPRVFFPGDDEQDWEDIGGPVVEVIVPSPEEWQAAVDRARAERADAAGQHTEGTTP